MAGLTKLILVTGIQFSPTSSVEVIDLSGSVLTCDSMPDFPIHDIQFGAIGGYDYDNKPLVCGGISNATYSFDGCYHFNNGGWELYPHNLTTPRGMSASTYDVNNYGSGRVIAAGGRTSGVENSIEYLTPGGWLTSNVALPVGFTSGCAAMVGPGRVLLIPGNSTATYLFDFGASAISAGPALRSNRTMVYCSAMLDSVTGLSKVVLAESQSAQTEIYDFKQGDEFVKRRLRQCLLAI